jgi:AraC family transcriptional regulator
MIPQIKTIPSKKLIGKRITMSFANNRTFELWNSFMPRRKEITNTISSDLFSLQIYSEGFFMNFDPKAQFEKWAAVEVTDLNTLPGEMESLLLQDGLYAVFHYKGSAENAPEIYNYIFREWLPSSGYVLDKRPHFEILGAKYKHDDHESEEEIWIPVK